MIVLIKIKVMFQLQKKERDIIAADTTLPFQKNDSSAYLFKMMELANGDRSGRWPPKTIY
jgi:hypothetical protein